MSVGIGINGFGRMGRLPLRTARDWPDMEFVHVNEVTGGATAAAQLLEFDTVHGRWDHGIQATEDALVIGGRRITFSASARPEDVPRRDVHGMDCVGSSSTRAATR